LCVLTAAFAIEQSGTFARRTATGDSGGTVSRALAAPSPDVGEPYSVALGAYFALNTWDPNVVDRYTALTGVKPAIIMWYQDWAHADARDFDVAKMNDVASRGVVPMVSWEADDYTAGTNQPAFSLNAIVSGQYDAFITQWGRAAAAWGKPFLLRPLWEMNGPWYPWGVNVNGNTSAEYIAAWRHIHDLLWQAGATNAAFVWCPSVTLAGTSPIDAFYPGDAYVDWIALDGYNWGTSQRGRAWQTLADVFGPSYADITALTNIPMLIAETASSESGGDKADWIAQGFLNDLPHLFPRIRAVIWFDRNGATSGEADWRLDSSPSSLAAFRSVAGAALYQGRLQSTADSVSTAAAATPTPIAATPTPTAETADSPPQPCRRGAPCPR
jgi:hypothetical protein